MKSAREALGPHVPALTGRPDTVTEVRKRAAIARSELRLKAVRDGYESQCSRLRTELMAELQSIERGW